MLPTLSSISSIGLNSHTVTYCDVRAILHTLGSEAPIYSQTDPVNTLPLNRSDAEKHSGNHLSAQFADGGSGLKSD